MSWTDVDLVNLSAEAERVPEGTYLFSLLNGAKYNQFDNQKIELGSKIVEGEFKGRVIYWSFPNPDKQEWSLQAFKKFERALVKNGAGEIGLNEDPVAYLNREDVAGHVFTAPVKHREVTKQDGEVRPMTEIKAFGVKAVPVPEVA